ncbi:MAG: GAF domain-containing protein [Chloroflexi bacterium]|nr:GAF domain-containing protein [Chloroflexota bacterium]
MGNHSAICSRENGSACLATGWERRAIRALKETLSGLTIKDDHTESLLYVLDRARSLLGECYGGLLTWDLRGRVTVWRILGPPNSQSICIEPPPQDIGVLTAVRDEGRALRLSNTHNVAVAWGFPPGHPPFESLVATPLRGGGRTIGALYLAQGEEQAELPEEAEEILELFAAVAKANLEGVYFSRELAQEHRVLKAVQTSMTEGLVVLDSAGRIVYFNEAAENLLKFLGAESVGKPVEDFLQHNGDAFDNRESVALLLDAIGRADGIDNTVDMTLSKPERKDLEIVVFPINMEPGNRMTALLMRDVTNEREAGVRRDAFVSLASHELRTPMTSVVGFSELLLTRSAPRAVRRRWLEYIWGESKRLTGILDDLLNVSRIQSGKLAAREEVIRLQEVVEEVVAGITPMTEKHHFVITVPPDTPHVLADRDKVAQVLVNLLSNAVKYSPSGGEVSVSARFHTTERKVVVIVADQGIGIAPDDIKGLFSVFHRIRRPETEGIRGTGLGLYIVKTLVELMGGEVWVTSELNKGSSFFFSIPAAVSSTQSKEG